MHVPLLASLWKVLGIPGETQDYNCNNAMLWGLKQGGKTAPKQIAVFKHRVHQWNCALPTELLDMQATCLWLVSVEKLRMFLINVKVNNNSFLSSCEWTHTRSTDNNFNN